MNQMTCKLDDIVDRLAPEGTLTASDVKLLVHAIEQVHDGSSSPALCGPYWEARQKALLDRKSEASGRT